MSENKEEEILEIWDLFARVAKAYKRLLEIELGSVGINRSELKVLKVLSTGKEMPINVIADQTDLTGPWITGVVNNLVGKGYAKKSRDRNDRRMMRVSIKEKGASVILQGDEISRKIIVASLPKIEGDDLSVFRNVLLAFERSLENYMGQIAVQ